MSIDLRGGASAPLGAPPRVLVVVTGVTPGAGASMVAATIADAACALSTADGSGVPVALVYPCDDVAADDVKNGATATAPVNDGLLAGARESGARFVMPEPGHTPSTDDAAWLQAGGNPDVLVVDVSADNRQRWLNMPAALTVEVLVARPSIPSIRQFGTYLQDPPVGRTPVIAVTAAHADTPELVTLVAAGFTSAAPACEAYFPLDHDLAITGVPATFPDTQLATARSILTRVGALEGALA